MGLDGFKAWITLLLFSVAWRWEIEISGEVRVKEVDFEAGKNQNNSYKIKDSTLILFLIAIIGLFQWDPTC